MEEIPELVEVERIEGVVFEDIVRISKFIAGSEGLVSDIIGSVTDSDGCGTSFRIQSKRK